MDITVKINGMCPAQNHIFMTVTVNGSKTFNLSLTKADFSTLDIAPEDAIALLLRNFVKESGLTNWSQIKSAIEGHTFKL